MISTAAMAAPSGFLTRRIMEMVWKWGPEKKRFLAYFRLEGWRRCWFLQPGFMVRLF